MPKITAELFRAVGELAIGAKQRRRKEYVDFLAFYRELVETLPTEVVQLFGKLDVSVVPKSTGKIETYGLILNATDFVWWKQSLEAEEVRFTNGPQSIRLSMLNHLSKQTEANSLSPDERKALLALLDKPEAA